MFTNRRMAKRKSGKDSAAPPLRRRLHRRQRGASLLLAGVSMVVILAVAGLAIDLAALYVARGEAQRAADAAALAGAEVFVSSGFTSGLVSQAVAQTLAAQQAAAVGNLNLVGRLSPNISASGFSASCPPPANGDGCFNFSHAEDPRITVVAQRTAARGDAMPTFFMRLFGLESVDVSAQATAEAYNPSGGSGPPVATVCVKPWLLPNCDPKHTVALNDPRGNPNCPVDGGLAAYYVDPHTRNIVYPGPTTSGGAIGELLVIKPGSPLAAAAPSQFYPVFLPPASNGFPASCPSCGAYPGGSGPSSAALYRANIACCNLTPVVSGETQVQPITGDMTGPTAQGVDCLIHESYGAGMDILDTTASPFRMLAGSNNPLVLSQTIPANSPISSSDSIVTVPIYDGTTLCPGASCPATDVVNVVGLMQLFIKDEMSPQGTVEAYILNISAAPGGAAGGAAGSNASTSATISSGGSSPIPVRLIHN